MFIHGMYSTRIYSIWESMKTRCDNPNHKSYALYGGRGICVCSEWNQFLPFKEWALGNGYEDSLSLDRINSDGDYEPSNCRWVTLKEQANNRRTSRRIEVGGEVKTLAEVAEQFEISAQLLGRRLNAGWNLDDAVSAPKTRRNGHEGKIAHNARKVIRLSDNIIFTSAAAAAFDIGVDRSTITKACKRKQKTVRGHRFAYYCSQEVENG